MNNRETRIESLALAVASGRKITKWCAENGIAVRTAYGWVKEPSFKARVAELRRELTGEILGGLVDSGVAAVEEIRRIVREGTGDPVRLNAARAVLSEIVTYTDHFDLESRITELERRAGQDNRA
jgi:hypothetical protein